MDDAVFMLYVWVANIHKNKMEAKKELTLPNKRTACIFVIAINDLEKANTCDSTACL